mgnify:CR=1 FL=1
MDILSNIIHLTDKEDRQLIYDAVIYAIEYLYEYEVNSSYTNEYKLKQYENLTKIAKKMQEKFPDILH